MNRVLCINSYLMMIAWCLLLNGHYYGGILFSVMATVLLWKGRKKINNWRILFTGLLSYCVVRSCLFASDIPYFFPELHGFMILICMNVALLNEYLLLLKVRFIVPFASVTLVLGALLSAIIFILPEDLYSLFGKNNLYLMCSFIFLPYLLPSLLCIAYKRIRLFCNTKTAQNKRVTIQ